MENRLEQITKNIKPSDDGERIKIKLFILDNSNPYRSQSSFGELGKLRDFCEENVVTDIKFIEKSNDTTYIVVVYRE